MKQRTFDIAKGDTIEFTESVFAGNFRNPKYLGSRTIRALIDKESYGKAKQQHTFTLKVIDSSGVEPLSKGSFILRKGRNIYKECYMIKEGKNHEKELESKHKRGEKARGERAERKGN